MSVIEDTKERVDAIDPDTHCMGLEATAAHIRQTFIPDFDVDELQRFVERGDGPKAERSLDGVPVFHQRDIAAWTIFTFSEDDPLTKRTLLDCYFNGDQWGYGRYIPVYVPSTGHVDMQWEYEAAPSEEEMARFRAERDAADPILPE
jgi:hypothetical protein